MSDIADDLAMRGKPILPVLRLSDSDAQLADAGYAAECHEGRAIVRLGSMVADPDDEEAEVQINRLHDHAGLAPDQCDLVIDLFEVRDERDVTRAEPVVRKVRRLGHPPTRASITVTAGAMPQSLTALATRRRRNFSWGDQEIALGASGDCGPGNAMQWRARGTSHHLAHVADQLRRLSQRIPLYAVRPTVHGHDHRAVTCIERWLTRSVEWEGE